MYLDVFQAPNARCPGKLRSPSDSDLKRKLPTANFFQIFRAQTTNQTKNENNPRISSMTHQTCPSTIPHSFLQVRLNHFFSNIWTAGTSSSSLSIPNSHSTTSISLIIVFTVDPLTNLLICARFVVVPNPVLDDRFWGRQQGSHFSHKIICNKLLWRGSFIYLQDTCTVCVYIYIYIHVQCTAAYIRTKTYICSTSSCNQSNICRLKMLSLQLLRIVFHSRIVFNSLISSS